MPSTPTCAPSTAASEARPLDAAPAAPAARGDRGLLACTAVLAACSVVYELTAAQTLSSLAANTVVWYSAVIGTFLGAMGLGAFRCDRIPADRPPWRELLRIEIGLTLAGAAIVPALHFGHMLHGYFEAHGFPRGANVVFFGGAFLVTATVGYLTGIELPLLMRIGARASGDPARGNVVLGVDYVGSLVGALAFPMLLLPRMETLDIALLAAGVNLAVSLWIVAAKLPAPEDGGAPRARPAAAVGVVAAGLILLAGTSDRIGQYFLRKYYYYPHALATLADVFAPMPGLPEVLRVRSPYQRIDLMHDVDGGASREIMRRYSGKLDAPDAPPADHILFLNGDFQTNTTFEEVYHEYFAHVPVAARGAPPRKVALLGGGDGYLLREILKYASVEDVLHVDIDPVLPEFADSNPVLLAANRGAFRDPRVRTWRGDGFQWARTTDERFDAVYVDFPVAVDYDLSRLYSREFFRFVRRTLTDDGFAVFDSTGISLLGPATPGAQPRLLPENDWPVYCSTLMAAGFEQIVPYLTSLEPENEEAADWLRETAVEYTVDGAFARAWRDADEAGREDLRDVLVHRALADHVLSLRQGFVMLARTPGLLGREWHDPGVPCWLLDEARFRRAFDVEFPFPAEPDPDLVNSILRPRFPTRPVLMPRRPY